MVISLLLGLLRDLVFDSAVTMRRSFGSEMGRYLEQRGFESAPPEQAPAR
jgi:hypothetical protein